MTVVWQSAIPPTLCTIFLCVLYIQFATTTAQVCSRLPSRLSEPNFYFYFPLGTCRPVNADDWLASHTQKRLEFWYPTIQGLVGKLYVLSLFYIMYDVSLQFGS